MAPQTQRAGEGKQRAQQDFEGHFAYEGEEQTKRMEQSERRWQRWPTQKPKGSIVMGQIGGRPGCCHYVQGWYLKFLSELDAKST